MRQTTCTGPWRACALAALAMVAGWGCRADPVHLDCGGPITATVMSYNLAGMAGVPGNALADHIAAIAPDFVAAQECDDCESLLDELPDGYAATGAPTAGVSILYDASAWDVADEGVIALGDNDDGWGRRVARWAVFSRTADGSCVQVYSTHWCVPIRSPDDPCDEQRHLAYAAEVLDHIDRRGAADAPVILAGDFNVFDGFEDSAAVAALLRAGLVDVFRVLNPGQDGTTFQGNGWAPPGRIDYIFTTDPVAVLESFVDRDTVPAGQGSDHYAVITTVQL